MGINEEIWGNIIYTKQAEGDVLDKHKMNPNFASWPLVLAPGGLNLLTSRDRVSFCICLNDNRDEVLGRTLIWATVKGTGGITYASESVNIEKTIQFYQTSKGTNH